jgi:hypothetical protein
MIGTHNPEGSRKGVVSGSSPNRKLARNELGGDQAGAEFSSNTLFPSRPLDNNPTLYL